MEQVIRTHPIFVLWDIDHTLIENGGVSKENYEKAFEMLTGRHSVHTVETDGRTDPEIVRNMFTKHSIVATDELLGRVEDVLEQAMSANKAKLRELGYAMPGARDALSALRQTPGVAQSVLTGNIRPNALTKLSVFDLHSYIDFEIGGYGSDDQVRSNLVAVARKRALAKHGITFNHSTTILVGDTTRDVRAAIDGDAQIIAVATGIDSVDQLQEAGADVVLPDLRDTASIVEIIKSLGALSRDMSSNL